MPVTKMRRKKFIMRVAFGNNLCLAIENSDTKERKFRTLPLDACRTYFEKFDGEIHEYQLSTQADVEAVQDALQTSQGYEEIHSHTK